MGVSLCNSVFLQGKLQVTGGKYLTLIIPGTLGTDLKNMVQSAKPGLLARCHEGCLTLVDPQTNKTFSKRVVLINLGEAEVTFHSLSPSFDMPNDNSTTVWIHAYRIRPPDDWDQCVQPRIALTRANVLQKIGTLLNSEIAVEMWNFKIDLDQQQMHACIRVSDANAKKLFDCKDNLLFFRPFVKPGDTIKQEDGVVILWTKYETISALNHVAATLQGIKGFVANAHSLGVRVELQHVKEARILQKPNPRISAVNATVFGKKLYEVSGFPAGTSASVVVNLLASTKDGSNWKPWLIIPVKHITRGPLCAWIVRADEDPCDWRMILGEGEFKLVVNSMPSKAEVVQTQRRKQVEQSEADKAARRTKILHETFKPEHHSTDAWQQWREHQANKPGKGKGKTKRPADATSSSSSNSPIEQVVQQFRVDVDALTNRVGAQDYKINEIQNSIQDNHNEVMTALRALSAGNSGTS